MAAGDLLRTQRREKLQKIALWLADSGNHADCQAVEATLCTHYGVLEVRQTRRTQHPRRTGTPLHMRL
jgi:hypothetical protein